MQAVEDAVFVYGSLKRGLQHAGEMRDAEYLGRDSLLGAYLVLYEEGYPGLVLTGDSAEEVHGELYRVSRELLAGLDEFEECPDLYQRRQVRLSSGRLAWAYCVSVERASRFRRISGEWRGAVGGNASC